MLNSYWLAVPFVLQMLCIAADELWFHRKRGLPRWERIGHPLDTLTVVLCLLWILCVKPDHRAVTVYIILAAFSCVFVAKDEPVHWRRCSLAEQWLHAFLFMLHPLVLASAAFLWPASRGRLPGTYLLAGPSGFERIFLIITCGLMVGFSFYQFVFWNLLWQPQENVS
jgi:hypothetical protein